ncbi:PAS domain-containing protein [Methylobacterium sp. J-076]|uniref:PAS domain-containing protein n=1 Tax=Methylobacterium sp. J-076 TaxID=2836655 RepID=UPI001FBA2808|nr:PAS domain-containing protein [Methylobacterium sp. J-076]MCJ2012136.1 PAS domain-containing protein [Methylobacterium sp. J-076]
MGTLAVTSVVGMWEIDVGSRLASLDTEAAGMLKLEGFHPDQLIDLEELTGHIQEDDRAVMRQIHLDVTRAGGPFLVEFRVIAADGEIRWLQCRGQYALDEGGLMTGRGVIIDVTDIHAWSGPIPSQATALVPAPAPAPQTDPLSVAAAKAVELRVALGRSGHSALRLAADLLLWEINTAMAARHTISDKAVPGLSRRSR